VDEIGKAGSTHAGLVCDPLLAPGRADDCCMERGQCPAAEVEVSRLPWLVSISSLKDIRRSCGTGCKSLRLPLPGKEHVPDPATNVRRELRLRGGIPLACGEADI
jgi:hypothetical protein